MAKNMRVDDVYTNKARKEWYLARSIYKLEEIDQKYHLFDEHTKSVLDIGCAPGSRLQYCAKELQQVDNKKIIGFDIKQTLFNGPGVFAYEQDITDRGGVKKILDEHMIDQCDLIISDMAPDTWGRADIDALRSVGLIEKTLWIYEAYLKEGGKFAIKVFMWPGFEELVRDLKEHYGSRNIVLFKPKSCRKASKETYIIKRG